MASRRTTVPSPLKSGLTHVGLSLLTFAALGAAILGAVHFLGDANKASPRKVVALFSDVGQLPPDLKRLPGDDTTLLPSDPTLPEDGSGGEEPSLGVPDPTDAPAQATPEPAAPTPDVPVRTASAALPKSPISGMTERTPQGLLPIIASDGRVSSDVYARPFSNPAGRPTISVVMGGLGLNRRVTQAAIDELPPEVTLSFVPYSRGLQTWVDRARAAGHEVLIELPMEPYDYPNNDTGPLTLLTSASPSENARRLKALMGSAHGYFGVTNYQGAKFATDASSAAPVMAELKARGLVFIHDGAAPRSVLDREAQTAGVGFARADRVIDATPSADFIDEQLLHLEAIALQRGAALGSGFAYPVTIDQLREWTETLEAKGYRLAPASSLPRNSVGISSAPGQGT